MFKIAKTIKYTTFQNVLLWLFITSGIIKPFFSYLNAPFDWTFLIFAIVALDIVYCSVTRVQQIRLNKEKLFMIAILFILYLLIVISLIYSPSKSFSFEKSFLFSINVLFFIYPLFIKEWNLNLQYNLFLFILLPLTVWFIVAKTLYFSPLNSSYRLVSIRFYDIRKFYLGFGMGLCILAILQVYLKKSYLVGFFSIVVLLGLGARGALIFLMITLLVWKWKSLLVKIMDFRIKPKILRNLAIASTVLPIILITQYEKIYSFLYLGIIRFTSLFQIGEDKSVLGRVERITFTIDYIFNSLSTFLFGNGIGSFGIIYSGQDKREYPHNIFLEVFFELGIFFLLLFLIFLFLPFFYKRRILFKLFVFYFLLNALKSGDLVGLWLLFIFIGLLVFNPKIKDEVTS
ncbi:O-antigen ligase like membrane protein [Zobellia roscoffensis]